MIRERDIQMDDDGDLVVGANGDFKLATAARTAVQDVATRVRTGFEDHALHPVLGSNIASLVGSPNKRITWDTIKTMVTRSLSYDGRFPNSAIHVDVVPISNTQVVLLVGLVDVIDGFTSNEVLVTALSFDRTVGTVTVMR